jgi:uncharacterized protein (TIGR02118 family)
MSVTVTVLYAEPVDPERFERHYVEVHRPLVLAMPGLLRLETSRAVASADGSSPPYYRTAVLWFASMGGVRAAFASPAGRATAADLERLAPEGARLFLSVVDDPGADESPS